MALIVETGAVVAGANALASGPFVAQFLAERGLIAVDDAVAASTAGDVTYAAPGTLTRATGSWVADGLIAGRVVEVGGAATKAANKGFAYLDRVEAGTLTLSWLAFEAEGPISATITTYAARGWYGTRQRLEATIINATTHLNTYPWNGWPLATTHTLSWPRSEVWVDGGSPYYEPGSQIPDGEIPLGLQRAVARLSYEDAQRPLAEVVDQGRLVTSQTVGPISRTFAYPGKPRRFPAVVREIWGLYSSPASGLTMKLERV